MWAQYQLLTRNLGLVLWIRKWTPFWKCEVVLVWSYFWSWSNEGTGTKHLSTAHSWSNLGPYRKIWVASSLQLDWLNMHKSFKIQDIWLHYLSGVFTPVVCISRWTSRVGLQSLFLESTNYWTPNWGLNAHLVRHFILNLPETNQADLQLMSTCLTVRLITSVSSCTSSIVGHGSAICARGIFAGFFRVPPRRLGYGLPRFLLVPLLSSAAHRAAPSLGSKVQLQEIYQHLALLSRRGRRARRRCRL